jgi:G3E family GTPase
MTKIDVFSGFLGAGKTTLIKKLIKEAYAGEKLVLIENEFGKVGIDGGFLQDAGIEITEMNSGCICCSLVGDFGKAMAEVIEKFHPDRIVIEPSGVGKLSDVLAAVAKVESDDVKVCGAATVADAAKCKMYMKNFGEFYDNQIANANAIILSRTAGMKAEKIDEVVAMLREKNADAIIVTTPWDMLDGKKILEVIDGSKKPLEFHDDEDEHEHHHHHHHDHECDDPECECHHHHHHHHHADEVFESIGAETTKKFTMDEIKEKLEALNDEEKYGNILRAKGIVACECGKFIYFDFVPGEADVRAGEPDVIGKLCVIGSKINKDAVSELFGVKLKA